jgi:glutathione S-transferase
MVASSEEAPMITFYGFGRVHEKVIGLTRDLRVQWALEETGLPYRVHAVDHTGGEHQSEEYRRLNPFMQLPVIDDDGFVLSESGAIVLYLAEKAGKLVPSDVQGRTQVMRWCFVALSTVEPPIQELGLIDLKGASDPNGAIWRPGMVQWSQHVSRKLETWLADRQYLLGDDFTAADILMSTVYRQVRNSGVLDDFPRIRAYRERCEARPAWLRTVEAYEKRLHVAPGTAR